MLFTLGLSAMIGATALGNSTQARGEAPRSCDAPSFASSGDPSSWDGFELVHTRNLYRVQRRPHARFPHGVAMVIRAPEGTTAGDIHRALECTAHTDAATSPAAVQDARVEVRRDGGRYVVEITSGTRSHALEIQRRAAALTR